ncbi:MAG: TonB-dependent receptor plug domain-containing protein [Proteobacteria bacterium]|nr:TonB-dependent receptor plug domain-containing protein [Pseudomonadota bacterium]MBU4295953.1 TonB-dependent receptor plug domain-containing protein [Pseudomonadota bacterium]MCG2746163.1 TonB-dependent receptor plug domain-containing protein [Desulfobulbaceae bacterium]
MMRKHVGRAKKTGCVAALLVLGLSAPATAAEPEQGELAQQELEPIIVVDKAVSQREDLAPDSPTNPYRVESSARFGTEVLTQKDIEDIHPGDVFDLLDKATGINLTYQGRKSPYFVEERGGGSFTYIIDGAVLPPSSNRILYKFPVSAIEEMQIVRGATSLTLGPSIPIGASSSGSSLNTGFIIIRTKQPQKTEAILTGSVEKANGGHPAETSESLYAGTRIEGDYPVKGYLGGLVTKKDRPSHDSWFDGRSSESGMGSAGFRLGRFSLNMMAYKDSGTLEMQRGIDVNGNLSNVKWYYDPLETTIYSGDMTLEWTAGQTTLLNIFRTDYEQTERNESFSSSVSSRRDYSEETSGVGLRHNARFGNTLVQLGGQMSNSKGFGPNLSTSYNKYDTTVMGWSASVEEKLLGGNLILDGGYRQDTKHIDNSASSRSAVNASDDASNDVDMDPAKIYALGARWLLTDTYALNGRYYYGDQGTSGDFDMRSQTDDLHPEKQERVEIGLEADYAPWCKPMLTWFSIDTENKKTATSTTYVLDGGTYYYYTESDEVRRGIELLIKGNIGANTTYKLSWSHMLDIESTNNGTTTDSIGLSKPENLYAASLTHQWGAYRANLSVKQVDEWTDSSSPIGVAHTEGLGGYTRVDANIRREFEINQTVLTATLFGNNLGDDNYSTRYVTGYYQDRGRTLGLELSWAL